MENSKFDAARFINAQKHSYETALAEIRSGKKTSHWMWYIFPQLKGLGRSSTSDYYGLNGTADAREYIDNPVLGARLIEISNALLIHKDKTAVEIFDTTDAKKLKSCMTLFREAAPEIKVFGEVLEQFFKGKIDYRTIGLLEKKN